MAKDYLAQYKKLYREWVNNRPTTPGTFRYTPGQEAADKRSVEQQYRPYFQDQIDLSNERFGETTRQASESYSDRGMWGQAYVPGEEPTRGPVSGMRNRGLAQIETERGRAETAVERAYREAVASGVQGRKDEAYDIYQKTVLEPYQNQLKEWNTLMTGLYNQQ